MTDELREDAPHAPVLLAEVVAALAPARGGLFLDGTFGAGGYAGAVLDAGADRVIAVDRDPTAIAGAAAMAERYGARLTLVEGRFGDLAEIAADHSGGAPLTGVCLDIGVSSMQIDQAERGFSFLRDGPLDMRMERAGRSAADLVNQTPEDALADLIYDYGEERASRRIARRICERRKAAPFARTLDLAEVVAGALPRPKPGQIHPATRTFQALRIAVNDELGELERALAAAELALAEGGVLAVVTFHSLEDRIVKRFLAEASGAAPAASRHAPETAREAARFELTPRKPVAPGAEEIARNPRARSARLRAARRTGAPARRAPEPYRRKGAGA